MQTITLNEQHVTELNNFIQDLPVKFGLPLLNFMNKIIQENASKESIKKAVEEQKQASEIKTIKTKK